MKILPLSSRLHAPASMKLTWKITFFSLFPFHPCTHDSQHETCEEKNVCFASCVSDINAFIVLVWRWRVARRLKKQKSDDMLDPQMKTSVHIILPLKWKMKRKHSRFVFLLRKISVFFTREENSGWETLVGDEKKGEVQRRERSVEEDERKIFRVNRVERVNFCRGKLNCNFLRSWVNGEKSCVHEIYFELWETEAWIYTVVVNSACSDNENLMNLLIHIQMMWNYLEKDFFFNWFHLEWDDRTMNVKNFLHRCVIFFCRALTAHNELVRVAKRRSEKKNVERCNERRDVKCGVRENFHYPPT